MDTQNNPMPNMQTNGQAAPPPNQQQSEEVSVNLGANDVQGGFPSGVTAGDVVAPATDVDPTASPINNAQSVSPEVGLPQAAPPEVAMPPDVSMSMPDGVAPLNEGQVSVSGVGVETSQGANAPALEQVAASQDVAAAPMTADTDPSAQDSAAPASQPAARQDAPSSTPQSDKKTFLILGTVVVLLLAIIAVLYVMRLKG